MRSLAKAPCPARSVVPVRIANRRLAPTVKLAAGAPKTGQHTVQDNLRDEALALFFDDVSALNCTPTSGGVNNVVQYVETPDNKRYILRIYNNGNKSEKVKFEHEILRQLQQQSLSFQVPSALPSKLGRPHELLTNGAESCIFNIIPGSLAKTTSPEEVGRATGELSAAMAKVQISDMAAPIAPYFDLFHVHHAVGGKSALFYHEVDTNPAFDSCREAIDFLVKEIKAMEVKLEAFKALSLPMQLIHGDLHYDNVMVVDDQVSGLLDFEFCAFDWRAMELAVALSKYVGEEAPLPLCASFVDGFSNYVTLTEREMEIIPDLINLRIFSNVVYFTSRAMAKEDGIDSLTTRAGSYAKRVRWVNANRAALVQVLKDRMLALSGVAA